MEFKKIDRNSFRLTMNEKIKLYEKYGEKYENKLPEIYELLSKILNTGDYFYKLVSKSVTSSSNYKTCIEELNLQIKKYLSEIKDDKYIEILCDIARLAFNDYCMYILELYMSKKEPSLTNIDGIEDITDVDFIIDRYHKYSESLSLDITPKEPSIDEDDLVIIKKGDLFHGTKYNEEKLASIGKSGIESGQLHGVSEDGETYFCADFFKAQKDTSPDEICKFGKWYTNGVNQVVFVISRDDIEGDNAIIPDITNYDAYNENTPEGKKARKIVNVKGLPLTKETGAAILMGIPSSMISSIIVNKGIEEDDKKIEYLSSIFPKAYIVSRTTGIVIKKPSEKIER